MTDQFENSQLNASMDAASSMPIQEPVQPKYTRDQLIFMHDQQKYTKHAVEGARWFYWLAGLSAVNSIIAIFDGSLSFMFGLGITQVIDALAYYIAEDVPSETATVIKIIGLVLSFFIAGIAFLIGHFGLKGKKWILNVGTFLYVIDLLICLFFGLYLDALFHLFVLFFVIRGVRAFNKLQKLTSPTLANDEIPLHS